MPLSKLIFKPGLNRDVTTTAGEGGWFACDKIRFRSSFPEKIGGWVNAFTAPIVGVCRQLFNYVTTNSDNLLFIGTNRQVYVEFGGRLYNATPIRELFTAPATNNCFTTGVAGSTTVTVTIVDHGGINGDFVTFAGVFDSVGGIPANDFNTQFEISNVTDDTFTITVATPCVLGGVTGGGNTIIAAFDITAGPVITEQLIGWGTGGWGTGTWGEASSGADAIALQRDWWFNNFFDDVILNYRKGPIYYWEYTGAFENNRAELLSNLDIASEVPDQVMQLLFSQSERILIAFGCNLYDRDLGNLGYDPLLIRWANQDEPWNWTQTDISSSGQLRANGGSQIVRALQTRQEIVVWTENALYSLQFTGSADVFVLQPIANDTSIMGCRAATIVNDVVYWMGKDKFYTYAGRVDTLPCTLRNHIFNDFNYEQFDQVIAGTNEGWNEVWWYYPTAGSLTNNAYVIYNFIEKIWYYGYLERTAWLDSPLRTYPMAAYAAGQKIYYHENGCDDDGNAMSAFITSNDVDLDDGQQLVLTKRIIPDLSFAKSTTANPTAYMTLKPRNFPGSAYAPEPLETITRTQTVPIEKFTDQVFIRVRARQMAFTIGSTDLGVQWQLGAPRLDSKPDGRR